MQYIETDIISAGDKPPPYGFNYAQRNIIVRSTHHCAATSLRSNIIVAHRATFPPLRSNASFLRAVLSKTLPRSYKITAQIPCEGFHIEIIRVGATFLDGEALGLGVGHTV